MNDDITTALRELEHEAPDVGAVRAAVYQGIDTRARRKRAAVVGGAAASVIALAAGALLLTGSGDPQLPVAEPDNGRLVAMQRPALTFPFDADSVGAGMTRDWVAFDEGLEIDYHGGGSAEFNVSASRSAPATNADSEYTEEKTTVSGHPATVYVKPAAGQAPEETVVVWKLPSGDWASVWSQEPGLALEVANALVEREVTVRPAWSIGLAPPGYERQIVSWGDGPWVHISGNLCGDGGKHCVRIAEQTSELVDGPEPADAAGCERTRPSANGEMILPRHESEPLKVGKPREIDGSTVRLGSDGCSAVKIFDNGKRAMVELPVNADITPTELGNMAASIEVHDE